MALPNSLDPELRRRIELAAERSATSVDAWIERAVRHELAREEFVEGFDDEHDIVPAQHGTRLLPLENPPRLHDGSSMSDAVLEDRR